MIYMPLRLTLFFNAINNFAGWVAAAGNGSDEIAYGRSWSTGGPGMTDFMDTVGRTTQSGFELSPRVRENAGYLAPMVARAQNFEDVILRRVLQDIDRGFYIDIGAWHPVRESVTAWFYEIGWRGINVEPNAEYFAELERVRTRDINLSCIVGASIGRRSFTVLEGTGLSSGILGAVEAPGYAEQPRSRAITATQVTLDHIFSLAAGITVDFLKIDVEGMESEILNATEFERCRPRVILVEATSPNTQLPTHQDWEGHLLSQGYEFVLFDGANRFYLRQEDIWRKPIFAVPPCAFDSFFAPTLAAHHRELEAAVKKGAARVATLQSNLTKSESSHLETEEALDDALASIATLEAELRLAREEATQWEEARLWQPRPEVADPIRQLWPFRALRRKRRLREAREATARGDWTSAARLAVFILADKSDEPDLWTGYGHVLKELGKSREAMRAYRKALMLQPNYQDALRGLDVLLQQAPKEAIPSRRVSHRGRGRKVVTVYEGATLLERGSVRQRGLILRDLELGRQMGGRRLASVYDGVALLERDSVKQRRLILRDLELARQFPSG